MRILFWTVSVVLVLWTASYVSKAEAGPTGCQCTAWAQPAAAGDIAGLATCTGCPHSSRCANLAKSKTVLNGSPGASNACVLTGSNGTARRYESVRDACENNNMFFYNWSPNGRQPAFPNCHFGGVARSGQGQTPAREFGLPWCYSIVDDEHWYTGGGAPAESTLAIIFHGAPGWRSETWHRFEGYAKNIFLERCFYGLPFRSARTAPTVYSSGIRALTNSELTTLGFQTGGTSVHAGFCWTPNRQYEPILEHSCAYLDGAD
jgi:hypothetical protein